MESGPAYLIDFRVSFKKNVTFITFIRFTFQIKNNRGEIWINVLQYLLKREHNTEIFSLKFQSQFSISKSDKKGNKFLINLSFRIKEYPKDKSKEQQLSRRIKS